MKEPILWLMVHYNPGNNVIKQGTPQLPGSVVGIIIKMVGCSSKEELSRGEVSVLAATNS